MCGFFFSSRFSDKNNFDLSERIKNLLFNRGPDQQTNLDLDVGKFIFTRLAIIDLNKRSSQPMRSKNEDLLLMNNGEIYNYLEIKKNYLKNINFKSEGDTEVFLEMWQKFGINCLNKLRGMFSFLIYCKSKKKIYFGRDPLGIKPLFFAEENGDIIISSEKKVLREVVSNELNLSDIPELLIFGSNEDDRTGVKNIKRCLPGKVYIYDIDTKKLETKSIDKKQTNSNKVLKRLDNQSLTNLVEEELKKSIDLHLRSDVGYSIQLSGGVDSSLITAMASQISNKRQRTFGLEIEGSQQDEKWARDLVVRRYKCEHKEVSISSDIYAKYFKKTIKTLDSPIVHSGSPALLKLYESMSEYSPVAITGEGADEAFMGYSRYRESHRLEKLGLITRILPEKLIKLTKYKEALNFTRNRSSYIFCSVYSNTTSIMDIFPYFFKDNKFNNPRYIKRNLPFIEKINTYDKKYYLQTLLHRQDVISMNSSVECRTPFADKQIFNISSSLPTKLKVSKFETKKLIKKIAEKYLDREIIYRKKIGLNIPLENWLRKDDFFVSKLVALKGNNSFLSEFADNKKLVHYVDGYLCNKYTLKEIDLFRLLCVEEWAQLIMNDNHNKINIVKK